MPEEAKQASGPIRMVAIENMVEQIRYKGQIIARTNKLDSALMGSGFVGFILGLVFALIVIILPAILMRG